MSQPTISLPEVDEAKITLIMDKSLHPQQRWHHPAGLSTLHCLDENGHGDTARFPV
jgi:hypothetical protein